MTGIELLEKYDKAAIVIKQFYLNVMLESLKDESLPESFKEYAREAGIDNDKIAAFIDAQPRGLFDVFDANKVYIQIIVYPDKKFTYNVNELGTTKSFNTRKEAEAAAVEGAFEILNNKL